MKKGIFVCVILFSIIIIACQKENHAPAINSLTANPDSVKPSQASILTVNAEDPDEDDLSYTWIASSGTLSSTSGTSVTWTAPATVGNYTISVTAEDPEGSKDTEGKTIKVYLTTSYGYTEGENTTVLPIYDSTWTYSIISIAGAPTSAVIDSVWLATDITHSYPTDLDIFLEGPDGTNIQIYDNNYPGGIVLIKSIAFNGKPINGDWTLWIFDEYPTDEGTLNDWGVRIFWHYQSQ